MEGNLYTESFFGKKKKNSNRIEFDFDEATCDRVMKSFLSDLQRFLTQHGFSVQIREDNEGLYLDDVDESSADKLINTLKQFRKNVVKKYDGHDMIVYYNNFLIRYSFDEDDFGNGGNIFFQDKVTPAYTKEQLLTFIVKTPSNNNVWCGKNYISSGLFSNTEKVAREIFGEDIIISKSAFNMVIEFPEDYTEDADGYMEAFFGKKKSTKFKVKKFEYSVDAYAKATKAFVADLTDGVSKKTTHVMLDNIDGPKMKKHLIDSFGCIYLFKYDNFIFMLAVINTPDGSKVSYHLLYVEGSDNAYTLKELTNLIYKVKNAKASNAMKCHKNQITLYGVSKVDPKIFSHDVEIDERKGSINIKFIDTKDFSESVDDEVYTEASLNDSDMFKQLNKSSSIMTKLKKALKESVVLDKNYIEEQYIQITKTRLSPLSEKVIKAFDDGEIKLIYSQTAKVTTALPFVVLQLEGKMTACIFIADFCSMNKDGTMLNIEMKKLYTLMESAYVGLKYFTNPNAFARSSRIAKVTASIYSEMSLRILNREFALSLDKDTYDTVNYLIARFCLEKVLPLSSAEVVHAYAVSCCKTPTNLSMELASDMYEREGITSVESLIKCISKNFPKMAKLTFRYYFQRWISSFGTGTCLAIDSFPYLYYTISNVTLGAFLVNVTGLSEIVKNAPGMTQFYAEISRVC